MRKYIATYRLFLEMTLVSFLNGMIYMIRKIPLLGKRLGDRYAFTTIKRWLHRLYFPFYLLYLLVSVLLALLLVHWFFVSQLVQFIEKLLQGGATPGSFATAMNPSTVSFTLVLYVMGALISFELAEKGIQVTQMIRWMHLELRHVSCVLLLFSPFLLWIARGIAFTLLLPSISAGKAFLWSAVFFECTLCMNAINLKAMEKGKTRWLSKGIHVIPFILGCFLREMSPAIARRPDTLLRKPFNFVSITRARKLRASPDWKNR